MKVRDRFQCVICGAKAPLEIHHITYKVGGKSIVGNELEYLGWMATLCESCHTDAHMVPGHPFNPKNPNKMSVGRFMNSEERFKHGGN